MRLVNELYRYRATVKNSSLPPGQVIHYPRSDEEDVLGNKLNVGSLVIWQSYTSGEGMHIGKIIRIEDCTTNPFSKKIIYIKTADNKTIRRYGRELVSYLPYEVKHNFEDE